VSFEGGSIQAKLKKGGTFSHVLELEAPASFTLLKTVRSAVRACIGCCGTDATLLVRIHRGSV